MDEEKTVIRDTQTTSERLKGIIERVSNLPTPPLVFQQMNKVVSDPRTSAFDIASILAEDPAMSAKVLKLSNSAYYGLRQSVTSIKQAVIILGIEAIRSLVLCTGVFDLFGKNKVDPNFQQEYWRHSLITAVGARLFAGKISGTCTVEAELAFSAGLLHDIGKLIMHIYIPDDFAAVSKLAEENQIDFMRAEKLLLDYTHCDLGALFAQRWNLPKVIEQAIQYHHSPTNADEGRNIVFLVSFANNIACSAFDVEEENESELVDIFDEAKENLGISPYDVMQSISLLREEYAKAETFVRMAKVG